jgi:hypothetical protein
MTAESSTTSIREPMWFTFDLGPRRGAYVHYIGSDDLTV